MSKKNPLELPENKNKLEGFFIEHAPLINLHVGKLTNEGKIPQDFDIDALHLAGFHGLMDAAHKYNPESGANFQTYAQHRIRGKMLDALASHDAVPKSVRQEAKQFKIKP